MPAWHQFLLDPARRRTEVFVGIEDLLVRGDVVALAGEQVDRTGGVLEIETAAETDEAALWPAGSP
jgi:hypothetical protein